MVTYTKISKPTGPTYTNSNPIGKEQYDQPDIIYDSATIFYDGINQSAYTNISKPSSTAYTNIAKPT